MSVHSFWEADVEDHKGRKMTLNVHAVGLDPTDPGAVEHHLRSHGFNNHKKVEVKPADGVVNFHRYPVKRLQSHEQHTAPKQIFHTDDGHNVDLSTAQILGPDGHPIVIEDDDILSSYHQPAKDKEPTQPTPSVAEEPEEEAEDATKEE